MPIFFLAANGTEGDPLEARIRAQIPELHSVGSIAEVSRRLPPAGTERTYVLLPFSQDQTSIDRLIEITARGAGLLFFIFISNDISANDYKRLVRAGHADWVSTSGTPKEILDILARHRQSDAGEQPGGKAAIVSFVPSGGGVGNATFAIETAVQMRANKATRGRAVCLIDLDFQTSHVCDLLDIEPRLKIGEISDHPDRLDAQLLDLFVSHHGSGLDVLATARRKASDVGPSVEALDALFTMIVQRYDLILVDLPVAWAPWTEHILGASELAVVTGLNTIPSLRQVAESLSAIRKLDRAPPKIVVALNRCETGFLGGVTGGPYVRRMLNNETIFYVRNQPKLAQQSVNTGVPMSLASRAGGVVKDFAKLAAEVSALKKGTHSASPKGAN
jgi:pilus assembly protein CpaE